MTVTGVCKQGWKLERNEPPMKRVSSEIFLPVWAWNSFAQIVFIDPNLILRNLLKFRKEALYHTAPEGDGG